MKKGLLLILFIAFFYNLVNAQIEEPVKWKFSSKKTGPQEYELTFTANIENGWHLYSTDLPDGGPIKTSFSFGKSSDYTFIGGLKSIGKISESYDPNFKMKLRFFKNRVSFIRKIRLSAPGTIHVKGTIDYMSCNDQTCTPPADADFSFKLKNDSPSAATAATTPPESNLPATNRMTNSLPQPNSQTTVSNSSPAKTLVVSQSRINATTNNEAPSLWRFFLLAFIGGLAALLTPCVFPMIPMTVSFFIHSEKNRIRSIINAATYGISIIAIYTIIGTLVAVSFGPDAANFLSTHWLPNLIFFLVFMIFAFSFFGMFEIVLPGWIVNKTDKQADKGGLAGSFFMALTLVLVSFSCTGPIVGSILVESAGGHILKPIIGMFGFSLAFALPFTLFALFPSILKKLPKSGGWLNSVKVVLGFLELALGLKFLSIADQTYHWHILDREIYLAFWIVIFTLMGCYLLGKIKFSGDSEVKHIGVPRLILAILTFTFVVYLVPGMFGAPLKALAGYLPPQTTQDFDIQKIIRDEIQLNGGAAGNENSGPALTEKVKYSDFLHLPLGLPGFFDLEQGLAYAQKVNKPVFIDFTGHGCVNCREMEARVWSDPRVTRMLHNDFVVIALYVDDKTDLPQNEWVKSTYDGKIKKTLGKKNADFQTSRFGINSQPYYVLMDLNQSMLNQPKTYDLNPDHFVDFLKDGLHEFKNRHAGISH